MAGSLSVTRPASGRRQRSSGGTLGANHAVVSVKAISVLGSTGSIGTQTLELASEFPERFKVVALTAGRNLDLLVEQILSHRPEVVALADSELVAALRQRLQDLEPGQRPEPLPELLGAARGSAPPPPGRRPIWW